MTSRSPSSDAARSLDPGLLGLWTHPEGTILIEPDGWQYAVGDSTATVAPDGLSMTDAGTYFSRRLGAGPGIEGVWGAVLTDASSTYDEERHYRPDGTYTIQTMKDGNFHSLVFGTYTWRNDILATRERRALVTTGPGNAIHFDVPFGPDSTGTYALTGPDTWDLTLGATTFTFTRA